VKDLEELSAG